MKLRDELTAQIADIKNNSEERQVSINPSVSLLDTEKVIQEVAERDKRKNNIIIFGCEENSASAKDQENADKDHLPNILQTLNITEDNLSFYRLGKFDPSKSNRRPIKILLSSVDKVSVALRNAYKLRTSQFSNISVSTDRTPMQLMIYKNMKAELNNRLGNGETNLRIKYQNGIPRIISTSSLN